MPTAWYEAATSSNHFLVSAGMANVICASNIVEIYDGKQWMTMSFLPINCFNPWCTCLNNYCLFCQGKSVLCISIQNSAGSHQTVGLEEGTRYPTLYYLHYHIAGTLLGLLGSWWKSLHVLSTGSTAGFIVKDLMPITYCTCIVSFSSCELMVIGGQSHENIQVCNGTLVSKWLLLGMRVWLLLF